MKSNGMTHPSLREAADRNTEAHTRLVIAIARVLAAFREFEDVGNQVGAGGGSEDRGGRRIV